MAWFTNDDERIASLERRVAHLESLVHFLATHVAVDISTVPQTGITDEVYELVRRGKKVQAIKLYREITGAGLAEAKNVIDSIG